MPYPHGRSLAYEQLDQHFFGLDRAMDDEFDLLDDPLARGDSDEEFEEMMYMGNNPYVHRVFGSPMRPSFSAELGENWFRDVTEDEDEDEHEDEYNGYGDGELEPEGGVEGEGENEGEGRVRCEDGEELIDEGGSVDESNGADGDSDIGDPATQGRRRKPCRPRRPYTVTCAIRKTDWFESSMQWENEHFRTVYRVSKETFWKIVQIIQPNPIFQPHGRKRQRPVYYQLGVFLLRYGIAGSHARHPMLLASIGEGTVLLYCRRVIRAIREHGLERVVWPTEERKEEIKRGFKKICGLDGIIGALDGTLCGLETKPRVAGDSYISRKKTLSVTVQAMVDHTGKFIAFQSGWPGSRPDCAVWQHMWVYTQRQCLFSEGEFLLADGGYPLSPYVLIPFAKNELATDGKRRREFNRKISKVQIVVEWTFGKLKARFPALTKLGAVRDMKDIYRAIEAMMVVHNICHDLGDIPDFSRARVNDEEDEESGEEANDDLQQNDEHHNIARDEQNLLRAGRALRERCVDIICPR